MGVPCKLHELLFEGTADIEVVPDDGADNETAGEGNGEDAECVGFCCKSMLEAMRRAQNSPT